MEAAQLGFKTAVVPKANLRDASDELKSLKLNISGISSVSEAFERALAPERQRV